MIHNKNAVVKFCEVTCKMLYVATMSVRSAQHIQCCQAREAELLLALSACDINSQNEQPAECAASLHHWLQAVKDLIDCMQPKEGHISAIQSQLQHLNHEKDEAC